MLGLDSKGFDLIHCSHESPLLTVGRGNLISGLGTDVGHGISVKRISVQIKSCWWTHLRRPDHLKLVSCLKIAGQLCAYCLNGHTIAKVGEGRLCLK